MKHSHFAITIFTFCLFIGCTSNSPKKVERVKVNPTVIADELYVTRTWNFFCTENSIVITDSKQTDGFMQIFSYAGTLLKQTGRIGGGPEEYTVPLSIAYGKEGIFTWDGYSNQNPSICIAENKSTSDFKWNFISRPFETKEINAIQTDLSGNFIVYDPEKEDIITVYNPQGKQLVSGGKLPYPDQVSNKKQAYMGRIWYNPHNKKLLLCFGNLPYAAIYKVDETGVKLEFEKYLAQKEYRITNGEIVFEEHGKNCKSECCLTKDYILSAENDKSYTGTDNSLNSPKRHTISVYDYELNLVKIIDMQRPRLNIAAKGNDNAFYAIVLNPENCIVRVDL